jgi:hypothetical protein
MPKPAVLDQLVHLRLLEARKLQSLADILLLEAGNSTRKAFLGLQGSVSNGDKQRYRFPCSGIRNGKH